MTSYFASYWTSNCKRKTSAAVLGIFYLSAMAFSYLTLVLPGSTHVRIWLNDVFALLNGAYRVSQGQVPYLDFHALYGPFVFYIPALALRTGLEPSAIFAFDGVVVAAFVLLAGGLTMYRRFQLPVTLIALVFLWLLIVVPIGSGQSFNDISWGTFYNRHGWAAFAVMMLFYVEPEDQKRYDRWLDSCILASLAVFLLYTKITFGLIGVGFIFANMVISRYNRFISYISIIIIIVAIAFTEVVFEFNGEYFDNIFLVAASNSILRGGYWGLLQTLIAHAWVFGACAGAILATVVAGSRSFLDLAYVLGGFAASIVLLETVPIRLSPIPTTSRVLPIPRVKLGLGRAAISPAMSSAS